MRLLMVSLVIASSAAMAESTPPALAQALLENEVAKAPANVVLCIKVDNRDATDGLLAVLGRHKKEVAVASKCAADIAGSYEKKSKRPAMFLSVSGYRRISSTRGEVRVNTYRNGKWASYEKLEVEQDGAGSWRVVAVKERTEA